MPISKHRRAVRKPKHRVVSVVAGAMMRALPEMSPVFGDLLDVKSPGVSHLERRNRKVRRRIRHQTRPAFRSPPKPNYKLTQFPEFLKLEARNKAGGKWA